MSVTRDRGVIYVWIGLVGFRLWDPRRYSARYHGFPGLITWLGDERD